MDASSPASSLSDTLPPAPVATADREGVVRVQVPTPRVEAFLAKTPLFQRCDPAVVRKLAPHFQGLECQPQAMLIAAGAPTDGMGILFSGRASVRFPDGTTIAPIQPGDHFGDAALLSGAPSPIQVVTEEACRVLWLRSEVAQSLFGKIPAISEALMKGLSQQVVQMAAAETQALKPRVQPTLQGAPVHDITAPPEGVIPFVELRDFDVPTSLLSMLPTKLIRQHRLLPLKLQENRLTVGMVAPRNTAALAELRRTLQSVQPEVVAISLDDFNEAVARFRLDAASAAKVVKQGAGQYSVNPDSLTFENAAETERERDAIATSRGVGEDVIKYVNKLFVAGLDMGASDIHVEPTAQGFRVRYRVSGVLQEWSEPPPANTSLKSVVARIKVLAGLDITERRLPQDGRIGLSAGKRDVDLRVSTLPANRGEKVVMRVLEAAGSTRQLEQIFFEPSTLIAIRRALNRPYGGLIIGGPTGSGKTSSLYSILNERKVSRPDTNIIMVEDPIEYRLPGVTQVQVNAGAGLGFSQVLRAMLRQDPDVIVVGETRDHDTAVIALEAAMTGHLLLTSLHANNALAAIQRLENLGCERTLIAQSVALVLIQRLVRKLCSACRKMEPAPAALLESLIARKVIDPRSPPLMPRAVGCDACNGSGYVGRAAVLEALQITDEVKNALGSGKSLAEVEQVATANRALMPFWAYSAVLMQKQIVSPNEVLLAVAD